MSTLLFKNNLDGTTDVVSGGINTLKINADKTLATATPSNTMSGNSLATVGQIPSLVVTSISGLLAADTSKVVNVLNYHTGLEGGGGVFYWDASKPKTDHNGGTVIDPAKVFPTDWNSQTQLTTWFTAVSSGTGCWVRQCDGAVNVKWFGAKGDGITDDTIAIQNSINYGKKIIIPYGSTGVYKITDALFFNDGGKTLSFDNNSICLKKFYGSNTIGGGNAIVVNSAKNSFINLGIDGNGSDFGGGGIIFNDADTYFTYECTIINPNIFNTKDSCIIFNGNKSGSGIRISGGRLTTYNLSGASSNGYPAIRKIGVGDNDASPRIITDVNSSSTPLIDLTGMVTTFIKGGQCSTILFGGNPDVTTASYISAKAIITGVRIRDGIEIKGEDHSFSANISHGFAPQYSSYGVIGTPLTYGFYLSSTAKNCNIDSSNIVINGIKDNANGLANIGNRYFTNPVAYNLLWTASTTNPNIGNGIIVSTYTVSNRTIKVGIAIIMGSTTTFGSGSYKFSLPTQVDANLPTTGIARVFNQGVNGAEWGLVSIVSSGSPSYIEVYNTDGSPFSPTVPHTFKANDRIEISFEYIKL